MAAPSAALKLPTALREGRTGREEGGEGGEQRQQLRKMAPGPETSESGALGRGGQTARDLARLPTPDMAAAPSTSPRPRRGGTKRQKSPEEICLHEYTHTHMRAHAQVFTHVRMHTGTHTQVHTLTQACAHSHTHTHT